MTSYELLDFYEEVLNKMERLSVYTDELSNLVKGVNENRDPLLNLIYNDGLNASNGNFVSVFNEKRNNIINAMQKFAMEFDILDNHQRLLRAKDELEVVFNEYPIDLEEEKNKVFNILDKYNIVTSTIYDYVKTKSNSKIVELLNKVTSVVNDYDKFIENYQGIKYFIGKTENKIEENEDEEILKLHFYDEQLEPKYFAFSIELINESYEIMCQILKISSSEYPLKVVKFESGSFLEILKGYKAVVDALAYTFKKVTDLIFNKYTFEGKVLRQKQILDLMKADAEVIAMYKELGYDITFDNEEMEKYHYQLFKSIGKMIGQTTKVKINDEELSLKDNLKQKYLKESKILLLEETKTQNDLEQDDKED